MKFKRDFILYSNINKPPPKEKNIENVCERVYNKIPSQTLEEMPQIRKAFRPEKKPYIMGIKKDSKPEYIRLDNHMSESDIKLFNKINDMKDLVYEIDKEDEDNENEDIVEENEQFSKNYKKLKKEKNKFNRGTYLDYEPFLNISAQYVAKNMKVPNLSEDHNLFSANPLILQGSELENYIVYNLGDKTKGVQFLNRLDEFLEKKLSGNNKMSIKEMERLEKIKREEKPKGYIPPELEISMLKNDINNSEISYKNIVQLEEFFKPRKNIFRIFTLKKNNKGKNFINNSLEQSPKFLIKRKLTNNFSLDNIYPNNNSIITATTSIGVTRKSSPKGYNEKNPFYLKLNNRKILPKLEAPIRSPSSIFNINKNFTINNKYKIRKISFNSSLKMDSRNNEPSPIFNSVQNKSKEYNDRLNKVGNRNKMYKLLKLSSKHLNINDANKKEYISSESEAEQLNELNKEIEKNKDKLSKEEIKEKEIEEEESKNKKTQEKNEEKNFEENKDNQNNLNNDKDDKPKKVKKAKIEKIRIVNKKKLKKKDSIVNRNSKSIFNSIMPKININQTPNNAENGNKSSDAIKIDPNELRYQKVENLFNITKEKTYNNIKSETKKDIESYLGSRGKDVQKMLTTKGTYYTIHNLMKKSNERNIILEEYLIRNRFNIKNSLSTKQKIILDKNQGFVKEIIKQENKFNEIIYKDKKQP